MRQLKLTKSPFPLLLLAGLTLGNRLYATQSGYLDAVKADFDEFNKGVFEPPPESTWIGSLSKHNGNAGLSSENLHDFSLFLKDASPGSFIFYNKLPIQYQHRLHRQYLNTGNLDEIKKDIFKYSSDIRKQELR